MLLAVAYREGQAPGALAPRSARRPAPAGPSGSRPRPSARTRRPRSAAGTSPPSCTGSAAATRSTSSSWRERGPRPATRRGSGPAAPASPPPSRPRSPRSSRPSPAGPPRAGGRRRGRRAVRARPRRRRRRPGRGGHAGGAGRAARARAHPPDRGAPAVRLPASRRPARRLRGRSRRVAPAGARPRRGGARAPRGGTRWSARITSSTRPGAAIAPPPTLLAEAARSVFAQAPAIAARHVGTALRLLPDDPGALPERLELMQTLAYALIGAGRLEAAHDVLTATLGLVPERRLGAAGAADLLPDSLDAWAGRPVRGAAAPPPRDARGGARAPVGRRLRAPHAAGGARAHGPPARPRPGHRDRGARAGAKASATG